MCLLSSQRDESEKASDLKISTAGAASTDRLNLMEQEDSAACTQLQNRKIATIQASTSDLKISTPTAATT